MKCLASDTAGNEQTTQQEQEQTTRQEQEQNDTACVLLRATEPPAPGRLQLEGTLSAQESVAGRDAWDSSTCRDVKAGDSRHQVGQSPAGIT